MIVRMLILSFLALVAGTVLAAPTLPGTDIPLDFNSWFVSSAALGGVVLSVVAILKGLIPAISGAFTLIVSLGVSIVLALLGAAFGILEGGFAAALIFGISAGIMASGGKAAANSVAAKASGGSKTPTIPR